MNEWQAIETAPQDGTSVLLWARPNGLPEYGLSVWIGAYRGSYTEGWDSDDSGRWLAPTHWHPLPEPPK